jgi:hypothetical protein
MYRSVVSQQGRVTLEADANEAEEIRAAESRAELIDVIGPYGSPDDGFKISVGTAVPAQLDFAIAGGTLYVGGVRVHTDATTYYGQKAHEWADYDGPESFPTGTGAFREAIYLALTEQEVGAVEDDALREVALGGPDSAARTRLIQRAQRLTVNGSTCDDAFSSVQAAYAANGLVFDPHTMRVDGAMKLRADVDVTAAPADPCEPDATKGYLGAENQLIRVKVVAGDTAGSTKLLWGYDNASFLYQVSIDTTRTKLTLAGTPVDVFHQPRANQWVEVLRPAVTLDGASVAADLGAVGKLQAAYEPSTKTVTLTTALGGTYTSAFLRVWENRHDFAANDTTAVELRSAEDVGTGVLVFTQGTSRVIGDYWLIAVRPSTPQKIYPARLQATFQPPDGPRRWIAPLAVISWHDGRTAADVSDCRPHFKNLVELTGEESGCCELLVRPGDDVQAKIDAQLAANLAKGLRGVDVRFAAGTYTFTNPIVLDAKKGGAVSVSGCGPSTELRGTAEEVVLVLRGWDRAHVSDLVVHASTAAAGHGKKGRPDVFPPAAGDESRHIGGAVTLLSCGSVIVERVVATCAAGDARAASCIAVRNAKATPVDARVTACDLVVGRRQVGVLIVNASCATVHNNRVRLSTEPIKIDRPDAAHLTRVMARDVRKELGLADNPATARERRIVKRTVAAAMKQLIGRVDVGPLVRGLPALDRTVNNLKQQIAVAAGQGIVVGGAIADDVRITHNSVSGAMEGIHVGLSVRGQTPGKADAAVKARPAPILARRVQIIGNTIVQVVPAREKGVHAGIFIGNVEVATVRDNRVSCQPPDYKVGTETLRRGDGIRVWGQLGPMVLVSGNVCENANTGITVTALPGGYQAANKVQWRVTQNLVTASQALVLSTGVVNAGDNVP